MAYFQVDKNPCKNLETADDYFEWAKGCYREANAFYKVAIRNSDLLFGEETMAVFTNIAFACELYFKEFSYHAMECLCKLSKFPHQ